MEINGQHYHLKHTELHFSMSEVSFSSSVGLDGKNAKSVIFGKALCFSQGLCLIGRKENIQEVTLRIFPKDDSGQDDSNQNLSPSVLLYYSESDSTNEDSFGYIDMDKEKFATPIELEIFLTNQEIEKIILLIKAFEVERIGFDCKLNPLYESLFSSPGDTTFIPKKEGTKANCSGKINGFHVVHKKINLTYRQIKGIEVHTVKNEFFSERQCKKRQKKFEYYMKALNDVMISQSKKTDEISRTLSLIKISVIAIMIVFSIKFLI